MGDGDMIERKPVGPMDPPANGESLQAPIQQPYYAEARSLTAPRSVLAQVVETQLLPPERFKGEQKGEVVDIKKINETIAVLKHVQDHYETMIYDNLEHTVEIPLDVSSFDLADSISKTGNSNIPITPAGEYSERFDQFLQEISLRPHVADKIKQVWYSKAPKVFTVGVRNGYTTVDQIKKSEPISCQRDHGQWALKKI